jgi:hypothetical protein
MPRPKGILMTLTPTILRLTPCPTPTPIYPTPADYCARCLFPIDAHGIDLTIASPEYPKG